MSEKMIVVCNHSEPGSVIPSLIFASSGIALDYEVHMFFSPGGAQALLKGELEAFLFKPIKQSQLFNTILDQGGEIVLCELALENKGIDPRDVRDERIVIEKVPPFLMDSEGAKMTFTF